MSRGRHARPGPPVRRIAAIAVAVAFLGVVVAASAFWFTGGRWFVVRTPSMGTAAPVGSLVLTRPTRISDLQVGDIIAFHPPTEPDVTYTHRIVSITPQGVHTRGDINGSTDPWVVGRSELVGRATAIPAIGWALRAAPLLIVGNIVVWGATAMWLSPTRRGPARLAGSSLLFSVSTYLLKPFVNVVQLDSQTSAHGAIIRTVSTGLLPIQLTGAGGHAAPVVLSRAGRVGVSFFTGDRTGQQYQLQMHLHLSALQWVLGALVCLAPTLWSTLVGFRVPEDHESAHSEAASAPIAAMA